MAWGRKKASGRKEPQFGLAAALADLRLDPKDRIPAASDDKPKKAAARRKAEEDEDDDPPPPPERKPRESRSSAKRRSKSRVGLGRLIYWSAVLGIWAVIAVAGVVVWAGAHLPPIQSLRSEEHTSELQSHTTNPYAVFCL